MDNSEDQEPFFLFIKMIQGGEIKKIELTEFTLAKTFKEIYFPILKQLKMKEKDVFLSTESGRSISSYDLDLTVEEIVKKFGDKLNLYYEKIM